MYPSNYTTSHVRRLHFHIRLRDNLKPYVTIDIHLKCLARCLQQSIVSCSLFIYLLALCELSGCMGLKKHSSAEN